MTKEDELPETYEESFLSELLFDIQNAQIGGLRVLALCHKRNLTPEAFVGEKTRPVYEAICQAERSADTRGGVFTLEDVRTILANTPGTKPELAAEVNRLFEKSVSCSHSEYYLNRIVDAWTKRKIAALARRALNWCASPTSTSTEILWTLQGELMSVDNPIATARPFAEHIHESADALRRIIDNGWTSEDGLSTGFKNLDDILLGLKPGLIILAARPSVGKTALAMNIAASVATGRMVDGSLPENGQTGPRGVLFVSLEMTKNQLATRLLCQRARINMTDAGLNAISSEEVKAAKASLAKVEDEMSANWPLEVIEPSSAEVRSVWAEVRQKVREFRSKRDINIDLVIIDYLQLLNCADSAHRGRQFEVAAISGHLKRMAVELNVPVLALSQLSRAAVKGGNVDEKPKLSDLRDSGAIEQDADVVLLLWRAAMVESMRGNPLFKDRLDEVELNVAKNRNGKIGKVDLTYTSKYTQFGEKNEQRQSEGV